MLLRNSGCESAFFSPLEARNEESSASMRAIRSILEFSDLKLISFRLSRPFRWRGSIIIVCATLATNYVSLLFYDKNSQKGNTLFGYTLDQESTSIRAQIELWEPKDSVSPMWMFSLVLWHFLLSSTGIIRPSRKTLFRGSDDSVWM